MKIRSLRIKSLRMRLVIIVAVAAVISLVGTFALMQTADYILADYYTHFSQKLKDRNASYIDKLQDYIDANHLKSSDTKAIAEWTRKHPEISVSIYRSNSTIYDSFVPDNPTSFDETLNQSISSTYKLKFKDAKAIAVLYGLHDYRASIIIELFVLGLGFLLFLLIVFAAINREVRYIRLLRDEIGILETGNLDYEVTIKGKDELADLASGLNGMRKSLRDQFKLEQDLLKANKKMVTSMSHDIRTPLTSILLYTEILKSRRWKTEDQLFDYISRIDQKTHRLKDLTDHLFEYALVDRGDQQVKLCPPETAKLLLYDALSEAGATLMQHGFQCEPDFHWDHARIRVNEDYIARIMDNIVSNITKYASSDHPVHIRVETSGSQVIVIFRNTIRPRTEHQHTESSGIGLHNISSMMQQMNGSSTVNADDNQFRIALSFPLNGTVL